MRRAWIWGLVGAVAIAPAAPRTALQAQETRQVWFGESRLEDGRVVAPVEIDDFSNVLALDMDLVFDSSALTVVEVRKTALLDGFLMISNVVGNTVYISASGSQSNQGSGPFLEVVVEAGGAAVEIGIENISLNGGRLPVEVTTGPPDGGDPPSSGGGDPPSSGGGDQPSSGGGLPPTGGGDPPSSGGGDPPPKGEPSLENVPGAPAPVGSRVADGATTLTVTNARPANPADALTYTFAVSATESFANTVVLGEGVAQGDGTTSWTLAEELPGREYWWRARAADAFFAGPWSAAVPLDVAPPPPADFAGRVGVETAVLSWSPSAADDLAGYALYRQVDEGAFELLAAGLTGASYVDQGLSSGVFYAYYATAVDRTGNESASSSIAAGVPGEGNVPGPPVPVEYRVADGKVTLTASLVQPVRPGDALTYAFEVSTGELFDDTVVQGEGIVEGDGATRWTLSAELLAPAQAYWWRARAADGFFAGPWSAPAFLVGPLADPGDFDGDGRVYFADFFLFADAFGTAWGQSDYQITMDLSGDGRVEWDDFFLFADLFGAVYR